MCDILKLEEFEHVKGEIYKITNTKNGLLYIGQTRTHRKNKNKYRKFGYIGRFKDHISEAINNTKKNQCNYLNNAIRADKDFFIVELIETCELNDLDEKEKFYIKHFNSHYPNGYNLTDGGKTTESIKILPNLDLNQPSKRGRLHGYKHHAETKEKIKDRLNSISNILKEKASARKNETSANIIKYYDNQKIEKLSMFKLRDDVESYIRPIMNKNKELCGYRIYIDRNNVFKAYSKLEPLPVIYERLKNILLKAKELSKNS